MLKLSCLLATTFLFLTPSALAEDQSVVVPLNVSFVGPVSFNQAFDEVRYNILCIGLIHCGSPTLNGISLSYISTTTQDDMNGIQASMVSNVSGGTGRGLQASFISNVAWNNFYGVQSSFVNTIHGKESIAVQGGMVNVIDREENDDKSPEESKENFNLQIGLVNYSDNPNTATLGFLNLVKGGRFALQLSKGAFGINRLAVVTGGKYFYTIMGFDTDAVNSNKRQYGSTGWDQLGIGVSLPLHDHLHGRLDLSTYTPSGSGWDEGTLLSAMVEYQGHPMLSLHVGVERFRFRHSRWDSKISQARTRYDMTVGTSINLTGFWK